MADAFWERKAKVVVKPKERRWPLPDGLPVARHLLRVLGAACERVEIGGSIRRQKSTVGDIELVCIPRFIAGPSDLFGKPQFSISLLDEKLLQLAKEDELRPRLSDTGRNVGYGPLNKLMMHVPTGIPVDIFVATEENWGMFLLVRTGPAAFNEMLFGHLNYLGYKPHAYGGVTAPGTGKEYACPDEETVFRLAGWPYVLPEQRETWKPEGLNTWRQHA